MGLFDRIAARFSARALDYSAELAPMLPAGDRLLTHCRVVPGTGERGGQPSLETRLTGQSMNVVVSGGTRFRPPDGNPDGIAAALSRDGAPKILAVTEAGLSVWDFGHPGHEQLPPILERGIARADVVSFVDLGGAAATARVTFRDRSHFDYRLTSRPGPEFWQVVAGLTR